jgi:poly-gamma-glutamate synthesis protein (capsule biosynthesis protein)
MIKITFTGDILCDASEIVACKTIDGRYDFSEKIGHCAKFLQQSDYVVGNLETPIADAKYCYSSGSFNSPIELAETVKKCGITLVSTANNHCLDRGVKGLEDTVVALDKIGLKHIGTYASFPESTTGIIETIDNMKFGFLSYTYGTNAQKNNCYLNNAERWKVNLFQDQELYNKYYRILYRLKIYKLFKLIINRTGQVVLRHPKLLCCPGPSLIITKRESYFKKIQEDISSLRNNGAQYVIMCLHAGKQHNLKPLKQTKKIVEKMIELGVDAIIGNHEHLVHPCEIKTPLNQVKIYSLGNFTSTMGVQRKPYERMEEYSILFHMYFRRNNLDIKLDRCSFTIAKTISISEGIVKTYLLYDLIMQCNDKNEKEKLLKDNLKIYNKFKNTKEKTIDLSLEYFI